MSLLKKAFHELLENYSSDPVYAESCWVLIESHYQEPHRHYHTMAHLEAMAQEAQAIENQLRERDCFWFALFYHDVIYDPLRQDNEQVSAQVMQKQLEHSSFSQVQQVTDLIVATQDHADSEDHDQQLFLDIDLAILGQAPDVYQHYANQIRAEYHMFPDSLYQAGRKQVLQSLLNRPAIYQTAHFRAKYETQARINLAEELANY